MIKASDLSSHVDPREFLRRAVSALTSAAILRLLAELPIAGESDYVYNAKDPSHGWKEGYLHWYPVGGDRGNGGRIKLATRPENPIGERAINAMEGVIELERQRELKRGAAEAPSTPREAVRRYFELPSLGELPRLERFIRGHKPRDYARTLAKRIRIRLTREGQPPEYAVVIEDDGIGQAPDRIHATLLSLGQSDKPDKPYLIGVFGQGGSSAFAACDFSWVVSRRVPDLLNGSEDGVGWTVVKHVVPKGRRDTYFAYLAAHPDGRVPFLPPSAAEAIGLSHGVRFAHVKYDFGNTEPARRLYPALNHLLFEPVLPYELYTGPGRRADPMYGNAYRLCLQAVRDKERKVLDKDFGRQTILTNR